MTLRDIYAKVALGVVALTFGFSGARATNLDRYIANRYEDIRLNTKYSSVQIEDQNYEYTIRKGDTFYTLAKNANVSLEEILSHNKNINPKSLQVGQRVIIPDKPEVKNSVSNSSSTNINNVVNKSQVNYDSILTQDKDANWKYVKNLSGDEFSKLTKSVPIPKLMEYLGITPGNHATGNKSNNLLKNHLSDVVLAAQKYHLKDSLLLAIIKHESGGLDRCVSYNHTSLGHAALGKSIYEKGLWSNGTIQRAVNPFNATEATERSAQTLSFFISKYKSITLGVTAYNVGETLMNKAIKEAKKQGIKRVKDIINVKRGGKYVIHSQGRNYYEKVRKHYTPKSNFKLDNW